MPSVDRESPAISIIVRWPQSVADTTVRELLLGLADARLTTTWAVEAPAQAAALHAALPRGVTIDVALLVASVTADLSSSLAIGIERFADAGRIPSTVQVSSAWSRGNLERRLRQAGVRAVVSACTGGLTSTVRALPFGVWEFRPHLAAPQARRWSRMFRRGMQNLVAGREPSRALACIDLGRVGAIGSRAWREVEQLVQQAADASHCGRAAVLTVSELAVQLSEVASARPQRSILRSAA